MKTIIRLLFILTIATMTSYAEQSDKIYSFIGVQTSMSHYEDVQTPSYGIKYGAQSNMWRTGISYSYAKEGNSAFHTIVMQMDRGVLTNSFEDLAFKPYLGFSVGAIQYKNNITDKGYMYGLNGGFTYIVNNSIDLDLGYRYMKTAKMTNIDKVDDINLALHYFY